MKKGVNDALKCFYQAIYTLVQKYISAQNSAVNIMSDMCRLQLDLAVKLTVCHCVLGLGLLVVLLKGGLHKVH